LIAGALKVVAVVAAVPWALELLNAPIVADGCFAGHKNQD